MILSHSRLSPGILVIGGRSSSQSVEFWSAEEGSCELDDYQREMYYGLTANFISGRLVTCYDDRCDIYQDGEWNHLQQTRSPRRWHSSAARDNVILLIGGIYSNSTEWIPVDGSAAQPGPFSTRNGYFHCTIQVSPDVIVVTGGVDTWDSVTEYKLTGDGTETPLTPIQYRRYGHACSVYQGAGGKQVYTIAAQLKLEILAAW